MAVTASRKLIVEIVGDSRSLDRAFKKSNAAANGFGSKMKHVGAIAAAGIAVGVTAVIGFSVKAVKAAVSLEQSMFRVNRVFGKSAKIIRDWSETTAGRLGINRDQALEFAGALGNVIRNAGQTPKAAAGMSKKLVELAADMAVFNKADPEDTSKALQRGLTGMMRGLKQYGVVLDNSTVKQEALRASGKKSAKDLTPLELTMARYRLILRKTAIQQGSAQKRSGTWTQIWRRIHASVHDLTEEFGTGLLPVVNKVARVLANKLADPRFREFVRKLGHDIGVKLVNAFTNFSAWVKKNWPQILQAFRGLLRVLRNIVDVSKQIGAMVGPVIKVVDALAHIPGAGIAKKLFPWVNPATGGVAGKVARDAAVNVYGDIHNHGVQDPKQLTDAIVRHSKKTSKQTRGRHQHAMHAH